MIGTFAGSETFPDLLIHWLSGLLAWSSSPYTYPLGVPVIRGKLRLSRDGDEQGTGSTPWGLLRETWWFL